MSMTLAIIKPYAVQQKRTGQIIQMIIDDGFAIHGMKLIRLTEDHAAKFYDVHKDRPFFSELITFMSSGPIVVLALEKENAVEDWRRLIGNTDPEMAEDGTVRKLFGTSKTKNAVHGSDSDENGKIEISFFFSANELVNCCI